MKILSCLILGGTTVTESEKMKTQNTPNPASGMSAAEITDKKQLYNSLDDYLKSHRLDVDGLFE